jgi:hypothetical protein
MAASLARLLSVSVLASASCQPSERVGANQRAERLNADLTDTEGLRAVSARGRVQGSASSLRRTARSGRQRTPGTELVQRWYSRMGKPGVRFPNWNFPRNLLIEYQLISNSHLRSVQFWEERTLQSLPRESGKIDTKFFPYQELRQSILLWHAACNRQGTIPKQRAQMGKAEAYPKKAHRSGGSCGLRMQRARRWISRGARFFR